MSDANNPAAASRWQRFAAGSVRGFHAYAGWLVGISWWRFALLSILLLAVAAILQHIPPFSWTSSEVVVDTTGSPPTPPRPPREPAVRIEKSKTGKPGERGYEIKIDESGVRITPKAPAASTPGAASAASAPSAGENPSIEIHLPPGATSEAVRQAVEEARRSIAEAIQEAQDDAKDEADAAREQAQADGRPARRSVRVRTTSFGDFLPELALLWIFASAVVKITYKRQIQAEAQAAQATETAEAESLKRQVVEARMAAMQAQVEPHFLFNTLASIDHLIETDPARASTMQKNLIALLRASMPTLREAGDGGPRDLKRELEVIRPYLAILKVRMEDRLRTEIDVPEGLQSAEFPAMMIQTLVENAIKHGLEPKPEGGSLSVRAEVQHGKLAVTVADSGIGFGKAATAGTGVGLANIRERLALLYGNKATLSVRESAGGGTAVTITVPYKSLDNGAPAA
ncbi:MAG: histidine kinase [Burkholderiaceae bacterium]|nr:histidine kinase [Ideonella sp.]MCC7287023.1 histidine kinase [Burkholderiaceae bacterium]